MNTYSTSPTMALSMARYHSTEPSAHAEARATLRAQKRSQRTSSRNPFTFLSRKRVQVHAPAVRVAH